MSIYFYIKNLITLIRFIILVRLNKLIQYLPFPFHQSIDEYIKRINDLIKYKDTGKTVAYLTIIAQGSESFQTAEE